MHKRSNLIASVLVISALANAGCSNGDVDVVNGSSHDSALSVPDLVLMTYNIKSGYAPLSSMGDPTMATFADTILAADPDIVALQEIGSLQMGGVTYDGVDFDNVYYEDQVRTLAELTGMYAAIAFGADRAHSYYIDINDTVAGKSAVGGVAILSKFPFVGEAQFIDLARDPDSEGIYPFDDSNRTAAAKVTVEVPVDFTTMLTDIYSVHLTEDDVRRAEQAQEIERVVDPRRAAFILGDMNTEDPLAAMPAWIDPRAGQAPFPSYPSWELPKNRNKQIDWILYRNIKSLVLDDAAISKATASDHDAWTIKVRIGAQCPTMSTTNPDPDFCDSRATCGKCLVGEGDCDSDDDCARGLVCSVNAGTRYGLPEVYDICEVPNNNAGTIPGKAQLSYANTGPASIYPNVVGALVNVAADDTFDVRVRYGTKSSNRMATLFVDGVARAHKLVLEDTGSWTPSADATFHGIALPAGKHVFKVVFEANGVNVDYLDFTSSAPGPFGGQPWELPGLIQAEDYDVGGSYCTGSGNAGGAYRFGDDTDVYDKADQGQLEGGYSVHVGQSDWVEFTVNSAIDDDYTIDLRYCVGFYTGAYASVSINGTIIGDGRTFLRDEGPNVYGTVSIPSVHFDAGLSVVRVTAPSLGTSFSLDSIGFRKVLTGPLPGEPWPVPGLVEAENYDLGADAFYDTTPGNDGRVLRWDDVDLGFDDADSNDHYLWQTDAGETLDYTIDVDTTATDYELSLTYATTRSNTSVSFLVDGAPFTGTMSLAPTCGWGGGGACWSTARKRNLSLTSGTHVIRMVMDTGLDNVDYFTIER